MTAKTKTKAKKATKTKQTTVGDALKKIGLVKSLAKAGVEVRPMFPVGTTTVKKPNTPVAKRQDPSILVQFVTQRGRRVGVVVAIRNDDMVSIGTALCRRSEKFVQKQAVNMATVRARRAYVSMDCSRPCYLHIFAPSMVKDVMSMVYRCQRFYKGATMIIIPHCGSFTPASVKDMSGIPVHAFYLNDLNDNIANALPGYREYVMKREHYQMEAQSRRELTDKVAGMTKEIGDKVCELHPGMAVEVSVVYGK